MKYLWFASLLAISSAASLSGDQDTVSEEHNFTYTNGTTPFVKIIKTTDFRYRDAIYSTPAVMFIGTNDGNIFRCLHENPDECELFYSVSTGTYSLVISGEYLYAGLHSGVILRCELTKKTSCVQFHKFEKRVLSLAVIEEYLYAGVDNVGIVRCELEGKESHGCLPLHTLSSDANGLIRFGEYMYAGHWNGEVRRCSLRTTSSCATLYNTTAVMGITSIGNSVFVLTWNGDLWNCTQKSDAPDCESVALGKNDMWDVAAFKNILYVVNEEGIYTCDGRRNTSCASYGHHKHATAIAFGYATFEIQHRYKNEQSSCIWQGYNCPPFVMYYEPHQRVMFEVHVKDGKLRNYLGDLVDTTHADVGESGPAAVFAMGPDGRLLLSNAHVKKLVHTSSLFAGNPVAGAGEMVVKRGVILNMTTCSKHYRPTLALDRQVVDSLRSQGYMDPINLRECSEGDNDEYGQFNNF